MKKYDFKENIYIIHIYNLFKYIFFKIAPKAFLKYHFQKRAGYKLNLKAPQTYNEKLQWLKLHWYDVKVFDYVDKEKFKSILANLGLKNHIIPTVNIYNNINEIPFDDLPKNVIFKPTHLSGRSVIINDNTETNLREIKKTMSKWYRLKHYYNSFEWVYKKLDPKIICEKLIETTDGKLPKDYKFFCFNGKPKLLFVASDRGEATKFDFYDMNWNKLDLQQHYPNSSSTIEKPINFDEMTDIVTKISYGFPHVRVDLYSEKNHIYVGEVTFFHFSGNQPFKPLKYDYILGQYIDLSNVRNTHD